MKYGIQLIRNGYKVDLTSESIIGLSYIQTNNGTQGKIVDLTKVSKFAQKWSGYIHSTPVPNDGGAVEWSPPKTARQIAIADGSLNKDNIFLAVSSNVTSLNGVTLEPWAMPGYFCIYDQSNHHIYYGQGSNEVTCFFGATK